MKFWLYWTMGWHMLLDVWRTAPGCSGPCNGGRTACKCETGRKNGGPNERRQMQQAPD